MFYLQLRRAFMMPFSGSKRWKLLAIGGLLWLLPILANGAVHDWLGLDKHEPLLLSVLLPCLAVTLLLTTGYCARVVREEASAAPDKLPTEPPAFDKWMELLGDGARILIPAAVYIGGFVAAVLLTRAITGFPIFEHSKLKTAGWLAEAVHVIFLGISFMLLYNVLPSMAVHVSVKGNLKAGFQFATIFKRICPKEGSEAAMGTVVLFLLTVPFICTGLLFPPALFAAQIASANLWAQAYRLSATCGWAGAPNDSPETGNTTEASQQ